MLTERLFGRPAAELTGRPVGALLVWEGGGPLPRAGAAPTPMSRSSVRRPDSSEVAVEYSLARSHDHSAGLFTLVVRDISARKAAATSICPRWPRSA